MCIARPRYYIYFDSNKLAGFLLCSVQYMSTRGERSCRMEALVLPSTHSLSSLPRLTCPLPFTSILPPGPHIGTSKLPSQSRSPRQWLSDYAATQYISHHRFGLSCFDRFPSPQGPSRIPLRLKQFVFTASLRYSGRPAGNLAIRPESCFCSTPRRTVVL